MIVHSKEILWVPVAQSTRVKHFVQVMEYLWYKECRWLWKRPILPKWVMYAIQSLGIGRLDVIGKLPRTNSFFNGMEVFKHGRGHLEFVLKRVAKLFIHRHSDMRLVLQGPVHRTGKGPRTGPDCNRFKRTNNPGPLNFFEKDRKRPRS